jgi:hypothetical protein
MKWYGWRWFKQRCFYRLGRVWCALTKHLVIDASNDDWICVRCGKRFKTFELWERK